MLAPNVKIFVGCAVLLCGVVLFAGAELRMPGDDRGYTPEQPIAYSHRIHAGELAIDCRYCHYGAETSPVAGIPPTSVCMSCHRIVTASAEVMRAEKARADAVGETPKRVISAEIRKLYDALALDDDAHPRPEGEPRAIRWVRVHDLPDHVYFDHRAHVTRGVECQACHGQVQTMERVRQEASLSMGWCIECHRLNGPDGIGAVLPDQDHPRVDPHVTTDCSACHF